MVPVKDFRLADIATLHYGNKFDRNKMSHVCPDINFVSRTSANNGISDVVDRIDGVEPYAAGCVSLAFGGSIGSCFLQEKPFYTGQNVGVIEFPPGVTHESKLYFVAALEKICKAKFVTFSDEINKHFKTDLSVILPTTTMMIPDWNMLETLLENAGGTSMKKMDTSSWKKFEISKLFDVKKGKRLTQADMVPGNIRFVGATSANNGETARIGNTEHIHPANTITVTYNGSVGEVFYQTEPFWASDDVNVLYPKFEMTEQIALFLISVIKKLSAKYSYDQKRVKESLENDMILLPVTAQEVPDWNYMHNRIAELERERITELEHERIAELKRYLIATGLNDYTLTDKDLKTLSLSGSGRDGAGVAPTVTGGRKEMREFRMGDLFDIRSPKCKYNANVVFIHDDVMKGHPYVVRTSGNNGIRGRISEDEAMLNPGRTFSFGQDTATVFWQTEPYFTGDKIKVLHPKCELTDEMAQYLLPTIEKAFSLFSWGSTSFSEKAINEQACVLPVRTDATGQPTIDLSKTYHPEGYVPDWDYMAAYIRAIEKLVIRDVVDFKDKFIAKTRVVVGEGKGAC